MNIEEIKRPDPVYVLRQVSDEVTSATFVTTKGTELLFAGTSDGRIYSWEMKTFKQVDCLSGHAPKSVLHLMTWRQSQLLSQGADGRIRSWWKEGDPLTSFGEWPCSAMLGIRACLLGDLLGVPCQEGTAVDIINLDTGQVQYSLPPAPKERGMMLGFKLLSSDLLLISYEDGSLHLVSLPKKEPVATLAVAKPDNPLFVVDVLHPEELDIVAVGFGGFLVHLEKRGLDLEVRKTKNFKGDVNAALILPKKEEGNECHFAVGTAKGSIRIICTSGLQTVAHLNFHTKPVTWFAVSPNGKLLAACSKDRKVTLWPLEELCGC